MDHHVLMLHLLLFMILSSGYTAPTDKPQGLELDSLNNSTGTDEVKQLEKLKTFGSTFSMKSSHSATLTEDSGTGKKERHSDSVKEVKGDGHLVARVHHHEDTKQESAQVTPSTRIISEVDIPSRGIHTHEERIQRRRTGGPLIRRPIMLKNMERFSTGTQYSPLDMAEYVFWTGDEKGVTMSIEEFLQEGLMTREEAISFLQEIKYNLDYLQTHYAQMGLGKQPDQPTLERTATLIHKPLDLDRMTSLMEFPSIKSMDNSLTIAKKSYLQQDPVNKDFLSAIQLQPQVNQHQPPPITQGLGNNGPLTDEDYEELLERLRVADFLYTEYSLEEVIYQLAKVMFSQSLNRGSGEAQEALQKFTNFLEGEAEQGHISRSLEKKVLDVLIASLTDTLSENPQLINVAREELLGADFAPSSSKANPPFMHLIMNPNLGNEGKEHLSQNAEHHRDKTKHLKNRNELKKP